MLLHSLHLLMKENYRALQGALKSPYSCSSGLGSGWPSPSAVGSSSPASSQTQKRCHGHCTQRLLHPFLQQKQYCIILASAPPFLLLSILLVFGQIFPVGEWILHRKHTQLYNVRLRYAIWLYKSIGTWSVWLWLLIRWWSGKLQTSFSEWAFFLALLMDFQQLKDILLAAINSSVCSMWKPRFRNGWKCSHHHAASSHSIVPDGDFFITAVCWGIPAEDPSSLCNIHEVSTDMLPLAETALCTALTSSQAKEVPASTLPSGKAKECTRKSLKGRRWCIKLGLEL